MITAAEIKFIKSLSQKKFRDSEGLFVVEGEKMVQEALKSGFEVEKVYRKEEIGEAAMARISALSSPSPVLALVKKPDVPFRAPSDGLYLALDGIRDPGNLGTILRIADWFGIDAVYASEDTVELYNPKVVQSTMGAIFRIPFYTANIPSLCSSYPGKVYGGNEANGISANTAACVTDRLFIPPFPADDPGSESLNAAVATAITVAEFRRQNCRKR